MRSLDTALDTLLSHLKTNRNIYCAGPQNKNTENFRITTTSSSKILLCSIPRMFSLCRDHARILECAGNIPKSQAKYNSQDQEIKFMV